MALRKRVIAAVAALMLIGAGGAVTGELAASAAPHAAAAAPNPAAAAKQAHARAQIAQKAANGAATATCTTSAADGGCGPYDDASIFHGANGSELAIQDVWNQCCNWHQTLTASSGTAWSVVANMAAGNTAVVSYPDTQVTYTLPDGSTPTLSSFGATLTSGWQDANPAGTGQIYEYAYDIWLNPAGAQSWSSQDQELMIWTDNHGQRPAGNDTGRAYTDASGAQWEVWLDSGSCSTCTAANDGIVTYLRKGNAATGSVDLAGFFSDMKASGYSIASTSVDQINYGLEICSTGGASQTYAISNYSLVSNGTGPTPTPTPTTPTPTSTTPTPTPTATTPTPTPTPTSTSPSPGPRSITLAETWRGVPNTSHYVVKWTPSGNGTAGVWRPTVTNIRVTVTGDSGGEFDVWSIQPNGSAVPVETNRIGL
jgi:hypothetical protein